MFCLLAYVLFFGGFFFTLCMFVQSFSPWVRIVHTLSFLVACIIFVFLYIIGFRVETISGAFSSCLFFFVSLAQHWVLVPFWKMEQKE